MRNPNPGARPIRVLAILSAIAVIGWVGRSPESVPPEPSPDRLRVLFIGNSYTYVNDLPYQVQQIAASLGVEEPLDVVSVTPGGMTLEGHWEADRARRLIREGGWSHVVLQEQSTRPIDDPERFYEFARLFDEEIDRVGAQTVLYMTWARQHRPTSQDTLSHAYLSAAEALDARVAPTGIAWQRAMAEDAGLVLHHEDRSHPSPTGTYLAALVFYATLYEESPIGATPNRWTTRFGERRGSPDGAATRPPPEAIEPLPDATAAMLQRVAAEAVGVRPAESIPGR